MWPFQQVKDWFFPKEYLEYRDSLRGLVLYLPIGDIEALIAWRKRWIPYRSDTDTGKPDGKYDPLQNYNGADLTIKAKGGDCESIAAVFVEVGDSPEWTAVGWSFKHILMVYADYTAHDVAFFTDPDGKTGWIDGIAYYGDFKAMKAYYDSIDWIITYWAIVNDIGEIVKQLE